MKTFERIFWPWLIAADFAAIAWAVYHWING
jgi:hypothetical protein